MLLVVINVIDCVWEREEMLVRKKKLFFKDYSKIKFKLYRWLRTGFKWKTKGLKNIFEFPSERYFKGFSKEFNKIIIEIGLIFLICVKFVFYFTKIGCVKTKS